MKKWDKNHKDMNGSNDEQYIGWLTRPPHVEPSQEFRDRVMRDIAGHRKDLRKQVFCPKQSWRRKILSYIRGESPPVP